LQRVRHAYVASLLTGCAAAAALQGMLGVLIVATSSNEQPPH